MSQMEVRCCCQPQKLLGWLPVPDDVRNGSIVRFAVAPKRWALGRPSEEPRCVAADIIGLPVATFGSRDLGPQGWETIKHLALKSEETPIEQLRRILVFIEAPEEGDT